MDWYSLYVVCFQFLIAFLHHQVINKETPAPKEKERVQHTFVEYSKAKRRCLDLERELELLQVSRLQQVEVYKKWKNRVSWFYRISVLLLSLLLSRWWSRSVYLSCGWIWPLDGWFVHKAGVCAVPSWIWGTVCERATFILFCYLLGSIRRIREPKRLDERKVV
ncbi:hypothetical protein Gasu2_32700 [Galdieria sulphuraria]|nr:hypothetical protein Gasu2_32700 [Galdieria sulphuraria]